MLPTIPSDAPAWVPILAWAAFGIFAGLFAFLTPRLRLLLAALASASTPAPPADTSMRLIGATVTGQLDGTKLGHELERIAEALEGIQEGVASLAKSEEAGQARMLESIAKKLDRLDRGVG